MKYTRDNPGCYHSLLRYLSEKTGICLNKEIEVKNVWKTSPHTGKKKLVYRAVDITVVDKDGQRHPFMQDQKRFDLRGIIADHFICNVPRIISEYGIEVRGAGNYRDSLGGGWYCNCAMFEIDGKFFASMECSCS